MNKLSVTLIGSYHKDPARLQTVFSELNTLYNVISPSSLDFVDSDVDFVKTADQSNQSVKDIENSVLESIRQSDFIWLFAPQGYVGTSTSFEIGFAHALDIPVYTDSKLQDEMLETMVTQKALNRLG